VVSVDRVFIITSVLVVSVCAFRKEGRKKKAASMKNGFETAQESARGGRDDRFCTGAGFIKQKYVSFGFSVSIGKIQ